MRSTKQFAGGFVLSTRGGDFALHLGQDVSIGYQNHSNAVVRLYLQESITYPERITAQGLDYVRPTVAERAEIHRIIMDELVRGVFKLEAVACFRHVMARMKEAGCDATVLGCTEIPLIMSDANSPLPTLDSTRLLARAALRRAIEPQGLRS